MKKKNRTKPIDLDSMDECPEPEESLWQVAKELKRRNDLLEVEMLCRTSEALRNAAKSSCGRLHVEGWGMAEELVLAAHKRIAKIAGLPNRVKTASDKGA